MILRRHQCRWAERTDVWDTGPASNESLPLTCRLTQLGVASTTPHATHESTTRYVHPTEIPVKITVETLVKATPSRAWDACNNSADIKQWNAANESWHTTHSTVDLREGGNFLSRMEAKDGSAGFDFEGTCTRIVPRQAVEYRMSDGREVRTEFARRTWRCR